jgi:undecaprenyl phosphate N,N'-diacetylbacillosamine 1-phosphate transferase
MPNMYQKYIKSLIDITAAFFGLLILCPLFLLITFILYILNNKKPFYFQLRPGLNEKNFTIIKFKTMNDKRDINGVLYPDKDRTTFVGKIIRKTSLDEIPQLINVLKGDMSLVGPRPLLPEYIEFYTIEQRRRHDVKPGITGWAQINGRNSISWNKKLEYDIWYVDHLSFLLDFKILFLTIKKVIFPHGINATEDYTMDYFNGKN